MANAVRISLLSLAVVVAILYQPACGQYYGTNSGCTLFTIIGGTAFCYYNPKQYTPQCSVNQQATYKLRSYNKCCGNPSGISNGYCCYYHTTAWNWIYQKQITSKVCICSQTAQCTGGGVTSKPTPPNIPTTKPTTTPTTTITTPTTTTTTTTTTTPTTTKPTTTVTTTVPTTTPTTTTPTTTAPVIKVCPSYRLLNAEAANECDYPGITSIEQPTSAGVTISSCNAVFVPARVGDKTKSAFFTTKVCSETIKRLALEGKKEFNFKIGGRKYPIDIGSMFDNIDDDTRGSSFFVVKDRFATLFNFNGVCQHPACVVTKSLVNELDYSNCEVVSYGASSTDLTSTGLRKVNVRVTLNDICADQKEFFGEVNTMCFTTTTGENMFCSNDMGAAVFCKTRKSNENVLVGSAAFQASCDTSPNFRLISYPLTGSQGINTS